MEESVIEENKEEISESIKNVSNENVIDKKDEIKEKSSKRTDKIKEKIVSFLKNKYNLAFLVILLLALLIRLKYIGQESIWNDSAVHLWYAVKAVDTPSFFLTAKYYLVDHVIPQTLTSFFYFFTNDAFLAGKLMGLFFSLTGIVLIYLLGTELKNRLFGLIAALILSVHHLYWFFGNRLTADAPLTVGMIFILYCFVKLYKDKTTFWGILSGISFIIAIFLKYQAAIFFIILFFYYLILDRKKMFKKPYIYSWSIPVIFGLVAELIGYFVGFKALSRVYLLFVNFRGMPFGLDTTNLFPWVFTWYLIPLAIFGVVLAIGYRERLFYFPLFTFISFWIFSEVGLDQPAPRHLLFLVPIMILFVAFFIDEIGNFVKLFLGKRKVGTLIKFGVVIAISLFVCFNLYQLGDQVVYSKSFSYVGHPEAGKWLVDNVPEGTPIFAGSPRMVRAFTGREYHRNGNVNGILLGGPIWWLRADEYLENRSAFEGDLRNLVKESDVYLEIDIWEYTQPSWYFPITQDSVNYFISLGFQLVKIVEREIQTQQGLQNMPVIFIFKKEKENEVLS